MAIINSTSPINKFDTLIRTNKGSTLMSFIMATYNAHQSYKDKNTSDIKQEIANRLKSAYDLYRDTQSGTYGDGSRDIMEQFESQYTIGNEMGIWIDKDFNLNNLALEVATNNITTREYISVVFLNLFTFYKNNESDEGIYHHFLYSILKSMKDSNIIRISKEEIGNTLPFEDKNKKQQVNLLFRYLVDSDFFLNIDNKSMKLAEKWEDKIDFLLDRCNLHYEDIGKDEAFNMAKDKKRYAEYVTQNWLHIKECNIETEDKSNGNIDKPFQRIFFGAPGTGKSFKLNQEAEKYFGKDYERVTFHPNYMYGNFVGSFKPFPHYLKDEKGNILTDDYGNKKEAITYKYVEGPLMRILVKALKNPNENYLLLIEEINRANTAAVFGDFFQLLDRKANGESEYAISTSEDVRLFLESSLSDIDDSVKNYISEKIGKEYDRLILPKNLYIWATMNSADQGVMPMDTAFKRRWDFTYIGIDEALDDPKIAAEFDGYEFKISKDRKAKWNDFRIEINKRLSECRVPEDKLVGPYFISKSVLDSENIELITATIKNKVLMYLYDDAGKPHRNNLFVAEKSRTYSTLCKNFDENGNAIFKKPLDLGREPIKENTNYDFDKEDDVQGIVAERNGMSEE